MDEEKDGSTETEEGGGKVKKPKKVKKAAEEGQDKEEEAPEGEEEAPGEGKKKRVRKGPLVPERVVGKLEGEILLNWTSTVYRGF